MKVYAPIVCNRTLREGESALYGNCKTLSACKFSLVRFGYADGLIRRNTTGQFNNRCMDLTASFNPKPYKKGWVVVMEDAEILAKNYHTITYEILCNVSKRAEKIYLR